MRIHLFSSIFIFLCCFCSINAVASSVEEYRPLEHLWRGVQDLPSRENYVILGSGIGVTLLALTLDTSVKNYFENRERFNGLQKVGNFWGSSYVALTLGLGTFGAGWLFGRSRELEVGESLLETLFVDTALVLSLKLCVSRERPDQSDHQSFPSSHSSVSFAMAGNWMEFYGPSVGVPALGLGLITLVSRLASNEHYLSDTVFGAVLGYVLGRTFAQHHLTVTSPGEVQQQKASRVQIQPYFESRSEYGLNLKIRI